MSASAATDKPADPIADRIAEKTPDPAPGANNGRDHGKKREKKNKSASDFWRACRFLGPHRGLVVVSIVCAFLVGLTFASGLGTLLPILRLLVNGDTIQNYAARQAVEQRLGVKLVDATADVQVASVPHRHGAAGSAEVLAGETINVLGPPPGGVQPGGVQPGGVQPGGVQPGDGAPPALDGPHTLRALAEAPDGARVPVVVRPAAGPPRDVTLGLPPLPWYYRAGVAVANRLPEHPVWSLAAVLAFVFFLTVFGNFVRYFQEYYSDKAAILAVNDIRRRLYDHVLHIPMGFFGLKGTSDVTSRLVQDAQGLQDGFKTVLGQSIQEPIKAAMAFGLALWFDWHLTLFIVLFGPLMFAIIKKFGKKMRRASRKALQSSSNMLGQLEGTLIGIRVVKAGVAERFERRRYGRIMGGLVREQCKMSRIDAMSTPILETLTLVVVSCVVLYAAYLVRVVHTLEATTFMGLMACLMAIGESLRKFSKVNNALQKANAAAARIFETLDVPVERERREKRRGDAGTQGRGGLEAADSRPLASAESSAPVDVSDPRVPASPRPRVSSSTLRVKLPPIQTAVAFENVGFAYPNSPAPALQDVSLTVPRGKCVAIVGRNGSGKTTLLALLPRFYDPQQGRVTIDGVDVRRATLRSLRRQIGIVTQEAVIFPGTIEENIKYGQPLAKRDDVIAAAKRAFAHEFILEKPRGYETVLGEHGSQLSGGQRQRLCIARAILRQTPILILDEATSQVDAESEHLIQQAIESLMHERTTFVIAHRFSTILSADTIVVMERGRIVGQGKHEELLQTCETYQQLYERQLFAAPAQVALAAQPVQVV